MCCWRSESGDGVVYRYDDTNPDARTARMIADRAIQIAAGQRDAVTGRKRIGARNGLALHRLCGAGVAGDESDGLGDVGAGVFDCGWAAEEAAEADGGFADAAMAIPGGDFCCRGSVMLVIEVVVFLGFAQAGVRRAVSRAAVAACGAVRADFAGVFARWGCWWRRARRRWRR